MTAGRNSVVIIGGGASGVIMAAHLLRSSDSALRVTLIEKRDAFGQGQAYSTDLPVHLLNVSARGMSALVDDPDHFWRWVALKGFARDGDGPFYAPRRVYGLYLRELLDELVKAEPQRLRLIQQEAVSITPLPAGVDIRLENGVSMAGHIAIIAAGHDEDPAPEHRFAMRMNSSTDTELDPDATVLILGTGLSMVDAWLTLDHRGHRGKIVAVSRRGLLPASHQPGRPLRLDTADIPLGTELSYFVRWFRDLVRSTERAGGNWRDVVDGLRPHNQRIWRSWPSTAKRRFLEHTKAWWDIHRHRMPPEIHERLEAALRAGRLVPVAGRVVDIAKQDDGFAVSWQPRQSKPPETLAVARIYDCTGIVKDVSQGAIRVVRSLTDKGAARPDPLKLGLDVTPACAVVDADGRPSDRLFAVGPLTRGTFFEVDAIPDIRAQCAALAKAIAA